MNKYFKIKDFSEKDVYKITLSEDMNDGDYMYIFATYSKEEFENNELLQLVLCYLNMPYEYPKAEFGHHYSEDINLPWLYDYLDYEDLIVWDDWGHSHTIADIDIIYYDSKSIAHKVELLSINNLLEDKEKLFKYMTDLYNKIPKDNE